MPYEEWTKRKALVDHLWISGSIIHVKTFIGSLRSIDDRSTPMIFMVCEKSVKGIELMIQHQRQPSISLGM